MGNNSTKDTTLQGIRGEIVFRRHNLLTQMIECGRVSTYDTFKQAMTVRALSRFYISLCCINRHDCLQLRSLQCQHCTLKDPTVQSINITSITPLLTTSCTSRASSSYNLDSSIRPPAILHYNPRHIEVQWESFQAQLDGNSEIVMDMFDAMVRRFKERTNTTEASNSTARKHHIFESVFIAALLAGTFDVSGTLVRDQMTAMHMQNDGPSCTMLFFPGIIAHRWVCYAWCLQKNKITIFDPSCAESNIPTLKDIHIYVIGLLRNDIKNAANHVFNGWKYNWDASEIDILTPQHIDKQWLNRTGNIAAQFCFRYDGSVSSLDSIAVNDPPELSALLMDAMQLKDNHGIL